jgi:hypothetical protein
VRREVRFADSTSQAQDGKSGSVPDIFSCKIRFDGLTVLSVVEPSTPLKLTPSEAEGSKDDLRFTDNATL